MHNALLQTDEGEGCEFQDYIDFHGRHSKSVIKLDIMLSHGICDTPGPYHL